MPGFGWRTTWPSVGSSAPFRRAERSRQAEGTWEGHAVRLLKPQTYMNRSGAALAPLRALPDFDPANDLLILVDDVAIPLGTFRLRGAGSAGGHNGLKSIEGTLQRQDYARLRIGVGPVPPDVIDLADFVLAPVRARRKPGNRRAPRADVRRRRVLGRRRESSGP